MVAAVPVMPRGIIAVNPIMTGATGSERVLPVARSLAATKDDYAPLG